MQNKLFLTMQRSAGLLVNIKKYDNILKNTAEVPTGQFGWLQDKNKYLALSSVFDCIGVMLPLTSPEGNPCIALGHYNTYVSSSKTSLQKALYERSNLEKAGYSIRKPILFSRGLENTSDSTGNAESGVRARESISSIGEILKDHNILINTLEKLNIGSNNIIDCNGKVTQIPLLYSLLTDTLQTLAIADTSPSIASQIPRDSKKENWGEYIKIQETQKTKERYLI